MIKFSVALGFIARNFYTYSFLANERVIPPRESFDSFPMFSHDSRYLAFASNRGNSKLGETNVFIAEWRD